MNEKIIRPYGLWPSPISAALISQRVRLDDVQWAADGQTLVWAEGRSGGSVLVAQTGGDARRELTDEQAPRGGVGYGGGAFCLSAKDDTLIFANRDGRLYRRSLELSTPRPITPAVGSGAGVASPALSPDGRWVTYVYSDGKTDLLCLADASGVEWPVQLARGAGFYMQPAWHPRGDFLAWVEWDQPNMPWDGTRVQLAHLTTGGAPSITEIRTIGGGDDIPAQQPCFSPDGRWLTFIEAADEWENLVLLDLASGARRLLVEGDGFELTAPAWVQGVRSTAWTSDSRGIFYLRLQGAEASLWLVDLVSGESTQVSTAPYTQIAQISANPVSGELAFLAAAPSLPHRIVRFDGAQQRVVAYGTAATFDPAYLPIPRQIVWDTTDGDQAYGLYYPPTNPRFIADGVPPAILHVHGGPTSLAYNGFNPDAAYFTSRGFAWVEVNYRGSTGYGKHYRQAMRQRWGDVDVEDTVSCARALGQQGLANPRQLVINGGSAGGFTVLNVLARYPGLFKAGVCLYGVANLYTIDLDSHKFEAHYNHSMIGPLPEASERYYQWSPVFHAANIRDALYVFQGAEDNVVPPSQSEEIVAVLREKGIPHQYKLYQGEGHGFRKSETITDYLKETERFLQQQVLFAP